MVSFTVDVLLAATLPLKITENKLLYSTRMKENNTSRPWETEIKTILHYPLENTKMFCGFTKGKWYFNDHCVSSSRRNFIAENAILNTFSRGCKVRKFDILHLLL